MNCYNRLTAVDQPVERTVDPLLVNGYTDNTLCLPVFQMDSPLFGLSIKTLLDLPLLRTTDPLHFMTLEK